MKAGAATKQLTNGATTALVPLQQDGLSRRDLVESRLFPAISSPEKAGVVMAMARAHDLSPTFVAAQLAFISGKPAMSGLMLAAILKKSGRYRYKVTRTEAKGCSITFFEKVDGSWQELGVSEFTSADAALAGLTNRNDNWKKFEKAMNFWRAMSQGARFYCPDALAGGCVHLIEELSPGTAVDEDGVPVIDVECVTTGPRTDNAEELKAVRELCEATGTAEADVAEHLEVPSLSHALPGDLGATATLLKAKWDKQQAQAAPTKPGKKAK